MKYIDADILHKEIERAKEYWIQYRKDKTTISEWSAGYNEGMASSYDNFLSLIDTIQQELSEVDLEKASRNVYESWMGGTMDDVRRDMVELGRVLNARKV